MVPRAGQHCALSATPCDHRTPPQSVKLHRLPAGNHRIRAEVADWYSGGTDDALPTGLVSRYYDPASRGLDYDSGALLGIAESGEYTGIDFALERGYSITGTVTLEAGAPLEWLEGVSVETSFVDAAGTHYPGYASIREDGTYRVERLPAGEHRVQFLTHEITDEEGTRVMPNLVSEYFSGATQEAAASLVEITEADRIGIDAQLSIGRTISGTVTLPEGVDAEAYDMLSVTAYGVAGAPRAEAWVEPDGQYTIRGLTASEYTVGFSADHVCWDAEPCTGPEVAPQFITVDTATAVDSLLDVTLTRTRSITGQVTLPAGADPEWRRGILVEASPAWHEGSGNEVWREAKVDPETGTYALTHLPEGSYSVRFTVREYVSDAGRVIPPLMSLEWGSTEESGPAAIKVAERDVENIDAKLQSGGKVSGKIASIPAGSNKIVTLTDEFGESYMRPTSPIGIDGSFDFGAVSDGTYRITLYTSTGVQFLRDSAGGTKVTVQNGESQQLELTARTTSSQIAGSGEGLSARSTLGVDLYERLDDTWVKLSGLADEVSEAGIANYQTQGLAEGTYSVRFGYSVGEWEEWGETYWDQQETLETATPITLTAGQQRADIDLRFDTKPKAFEVAPKPTIQGTAKVGVKLSAQSGVWQPAPMLSYQWLRDGKAIAGATKAEYTPVAGDAGKKVTVAVTGVKSGYVTTERVSAAVTVADVDPPKPKAFEVAPKPTIQGTAKVGVKLSAQSGVWQPAPMLSYQWLRDGKAIAGATKAEYTPVAGDAGKKVTVAVTGVKSGYVTTERVSAAVTVAPATTVKPGKPVVKKPFTDIPANRKFAKEINWMYNSGLSTGTKVGNTAEYRPMEEVSREAMAAFLYRLEGAKSKGLSTSPFVDVKPGQKFYKEISWMYEQGLSTGSIRNGKRYYDPKASVSREAMAAFLYRLTASGAKPGVGSPFADIPAGRKFAKEINWMYSSGLSTGTKTGNTRLYKPKDGVSREAMAAFMYRMEN